jgi:hypothetical protein
MDFKPKYIKDNGYDVSDEYLQALDEMDFELSLVISKHIDDNVIDIEPTSDISEIRGGIVHHEGVAYPYALEMIKIRGSFLILTDICLIDLNEYLDLINLNLHIKPYEPSSKKSDIFSNRNDRTKSTEQDSKKGVYRA